MLSESLHDQRDFIPPTSDEQVRAQQSGYYKKKTTNTVRRLESVCTRARVFELCRWVHNSQVCMAHDDPSKEADRTAHYVLKGLFGNKTFSSWFQHNILD